MRRLLLVLVVVFLVCLCFFWVEKAYAQMPRPGGAGGSYGTPGTDYSKPTVLDTYANVAALSCAAADAGRLGLLSNAPFVALCDSTWKFFYRGKQVIIPITTGWTTFNSPTITTTAGFLEISSASSNINGQHRSFSTTHKATMRASITSTGAGSGGGLAWHDGTKYQTFEFRQGSADGPKFYAANWTNATTFSADAVGDTITLASGGNDVWMQIEQNSTNRISRFSMDGTNWVVFRTITKSDFLTPNAWGVIVRGASTVMRVYHLEIE